MSNFIMVTQFIAVLAASGIALVIITVIVNRFGEDWTDAKRAILVTVVVTAVGGGTFLAFRFDGTQTSEEIAAIIRVFRIVCSLTASGIVLALVTVLTDRLDALRSRVRRAIVLTMALVVGGVVTFFGTGAIAAKLWVDAEAPPNDWIEHVNDGEYDLAERLLVEELEGLRVRSGKDLPEHYFLRYNLVYVYKKSGKFDEAEELCLETLDILRTELGNYHNRYCQGLLRTAEFYRDTGEFELAEAHYIEVLDVTAAALSADDESYGGHMWTLARFYERQQRFDHAEARYLDAASVYAALGIVQHQSHPSLLRSIASFYEQQDEFQEAESYYEQAMAMLIVTSDRDVHLVESVSEAYAAMLRKQDRDRDADAVLEQCELIVSAGIIHQ
jgi:tetratricopeptide (TPR) repeat protein